jgi:VanZ family protein
MGAAEVRRAWTVIGWIGVAIVVYYSLKPHPPELGIEQGDKIQHFAAYGGMMLWWVQLAATRVGRVRTAAWLIALGIGLEIAQSFTGYREASILDACANTAGVLAGWALAPPRLPDLLALATRLRARLGG